jgi:hypothetical protein
MDPSLTYASDLKRGIELDVVALLFLPISRMITSFAIYDRRDVDGCVLLQMWTVRRTPRMF